MKKHFCFILFASCVLSQAAPDTAEKLSTNILQRDGTFYSKFSVEGKNYYNGEWYPDPYTSNGDFFQDLGLAEDGIPAYTVLPDQEKYNTFVWGADYPSNEVAAQEFGYPNLAALLADPGWGGPYANMEELFNDWKTQGWIDASAGVSYADGSVANIVNDPAKIAAFISRISEIPEASLAYITGEPIWTTEMAAAMLEHINGLPPLAPLAWNAPTPSRTVAEQNLFSQAINPESTIYPDRSKLDFTNTNLDGYTVAGLDLSGMNITGAQLNHVGNGGVFSMGGVSFAGANLSGLDMTGFNPPYGTISTLSVPVYTTYMGSNLQNVNLSNAQNLDVNSLRYVSNFNGTNLSGTGITREALVSTLMTSLSIDYATAMARTANTIF